MTRRSVISGLAAAMLLSAAIPPSSANSVFVEENGVVVMEAGNTASRLGRWEKMTALSGYTGDGYLEFTGNTPVNGPASSPLKYNFKINKAGLYYLHLHVARETLVINGKTRNDVANDCYVRVEGDYTAGPNEGDNHGDDAPLKMLRSNTKFFGGDHNKFVWASGNRLDPGGHNNKRVAVYNFKAGKTYTLVVSGRSQKFKLNRIVFRHADTAKATAENLSQDDPTNVDKSDLSKARKSSKKR